MRSYMIYATTNPEFLAQCDLVIENGQLEQHCQLLKTDVDDLSDELYSLGIADYRAATRNALLELFNYHVPLGLDDVYLTDFSPEEFLVSTRSFDPKITLQQVMTIYYVLGCDLQTRILKLPSINNDPIEVTVVIRQWLKISFSSLIQRGQEVAGRI